MVNGSTNGMTARGTDGEAPMAKVKGSGDRKGKDARRGRPPNSPSGPTKPTTYRISPGGSAVIRGLSDRLGLGSQAAGIELGAYQLAAALERCDAAPPLDRDQLALAVAAVRAARVVPRTLGPSANFGVVLTAAVLGYEAAAVPAKCAADEYAALVDAVRRFSGAEALWVVAAATGD